MMTFKEFLNEATYMSNDFDTDASKIKKDIKTTIEKEIGSFLNDRDIKLDITDGTHRTDLINVTLSKGRNRVDFKFYASLDIAGMGSGNVEKITVDPDVLLDMKYKHRSISSKKDGSDLGKKFTSYIKRKIDDIESQLS